MAFILSTFACVGKNYSIDYLKKNGMTVYSIEKDRTFYKKYTPEKYVLDIYTKVKKYDVIFIPYFLNMEERFIKGKLTYYLIYPDASRKEEFLKLFKKANFTPEQIKNFEDNWDYMIADCDACNIPDKYKIKLKAGEFLQDFLKKCIKKDR